MRYLLFAWALLFVALLLLIVGRGRRGGALLLSYCFGLSIIHVPGALIYLGTAQGLIEERETQLGFTATIIGMASLLMGAAVAGRLSRSRSGRLHDAGADYMRLSFVMITCGLALYFILWPAISLVPSATAVLSSFAALLPFSFWCYFYTVIRDRRDGRLLFGLALLPLLPILTMVVGGFIGYGIMWVSAVVALIYVVSPRKKLLALIAIPICYLGLSFGVAYFSGRQELRETVWYEQADLGARIDRISDMVSKFELLDFSNSEHIAFLSNRLNQNLLVGIAIERHDAGRFDLAMGRTIPLWLFIPRAIWPEKPEVGGGGRVVSDFTGISFAYGTSVGAGQTLEFYVNFGWAGIVGGFLLLGYALMRLDIELAAAFRAGNVRRLIEVGLPGLALLQPGGNLLEILVAVAGSIVAAKTVIFGLKRFGELGEVSTRHRLSGNAARRREAN